MKSIMPCGETYKEWPLSGDQPISITNDQITIIESLIESLIESIQKRFAVYKTDVLMATSIINLSQWPATKKLASGIFL